MMYLAFDPPELASIDEVPIAPGISVVTPVRDGGHVAQNRVEGHYRFVVVAKELAPGIHFLLTGGVPGHLAAERIGLTLPAIRSHLHEGFDVARLFLPALAFQIVEQGEKNIAFH